MRTLLIFGMLAGSLSAQMFPWNANHIVGVASDPSAVNDGDTWYNTTSGKFRCRQNSENFDCTVVQDQMNRYLLRSWQGKMANLMRSSSASATIAYIGDSWTAGDQITLPFRKAVQGTFGSTGIGYVGYASVDSPPTGITLTTGGSWTDKNGNTDTTAHGVDLYETKSTSIGASKSFATTATDFVIHYVIQTGGGSFTWQIDGGATTTIDTSVGTPGYATTTISGQTNASHTLLLTVTDAGSTGVILLGADCQISGGGVRVHRIGHSGATSGNYIGVNAANWEAGLTALAPDIVFVSLYVNDANAAITPATVQSNLTTLVSRIQTALPSADIVLLPQADSGLTWTYPISQYDTAMRTIASSSNVGFIDAVKSLGPYNANAWGYWAVNNHPNGYSGQAYTNLMMQYLLFGARVNTGQYGNFVIGVNPIDDDNVNKLQVNGSIKATSFGDGTNTVVLGGTALPTVGGVAYVTAAGILGQQPTVFFYDSVNNRLCIGSNNCSKRISAYDASNTVEMEIKTGGNKAADMAYQNSLTTWKVGVGAWGGNGYNLEFQNGALQGTLDRYGRWLAGGTAPSITSGFGTTPAIAGKDMAGRITVGTGGVDTSGVITFGNAWTTAPSCTANDETTTLLVKATASTTTLTLTSASAWGAADKLTWVCIGY